MRIFRTLSTTRLLSLVAAVVAVAVAVAGTIAVAARGGSGATPPQKPLAAAIHDALTGPHPDGITARVSFTNKLFPSGALTGQTGSALMSSASGRLWLNANGGRIELQSNGGDTQITWNDTKATVYDASSNTAYVLTLPAQGGSSGQSGQGTPPSLQEVGGALAKAALHWAIGDAIPTNVAGQEAYSVTVSPKHDGGLLGSAELVWDAANGVPLKLAITAQGSSSPVLALEATDISFGNVSDSDVEVAPPAGAKTVDLSSAGHSGGHDTPPVTGLAAVQAAAPFTVVAPDTLVGLPRQDVRLVGPADSRAVLVTYGQGLGAILVVERKADTGGGASGGLLSALPSVSLDGITAHELATQLGTVLTWDGSGVSYVLAGSIPSAAAESAARTLK